MGDQSSSGGQRRRRRRRAVWRPGEGISRSVETAPVSDEAAPPVPSEPAPKPVPKPTPEPAPKPTPETVKRASRRNRPDAAERGLRDLVGAGPSQLGPVRAMRARDANRPTDEDLAQAEADVVVVRRNWKPRD